MAERLHKHSPRVAQRRHEQVDAHALAANRHPGLAEIGPQLMARRCLKPHRCPRLGPQRLAQSRHRPLDRPRAHRAQQILPHDVGGAAGTARPTNHEPVQGLRASRPAIADPPLGRQIAPHRPPVAPQRHRNPPLSPTQRLQSQHRRDLVRRAHPVLPPAAAQAAEEPQSIRPLSAPPLRSRWCSRHLRRTRSGFAPWWPCRALFVANPRPRVRCRPAGGLSAR